MTGSYRIKILALFFIFFLVLAGIDAGAEQPASNSNSIGDIRHLEEQGLEPNQPAEAGNPDSKPPVILTPLPDYPVLLVPESSNDLIIMVDPVNGDSLGVFVDGTGLFSTPICAMAGPDNNIYVSDQVADAVFVYDRDGNYLYTYADASDGLNNIRGIDFRNDTLFVTSGDDYVAWFAGPHNRVYPDFINDGSDTFDILFLPDDRSLVADIQGTTDNVRLYNANGTLNSVLITYSFPEQIQFDDVTPGDYLTAFFSDNNIHDFDIAGTVYQSTPWSSGRGVYRLGNGNLLLTNGSGAFEVTPGTGDVVDTVFSGVSGRFIELVLPAGPPPEYGSIAGTVTDAITTDPIEAVNVEIDGYPAVNTNSLGEYTLPNLLPGSYAIDFTHPDYDSYTSDPVTVLANETTTFNVSLNPATGSIGGVVTDASTTDPIENVHVVAEGTTVEDYTDINGQYTLPGLALGEYNVSFSHASYSDSTVGPVNVVGNQTTPLDVALTPILQGYAYVPGDANMFVGQWPPQVIGGDVTFLVNYFRGVVQACIIGGFYCSGDANGDCLVIGSDVTRMVNYFRGIATILPCPDFDPLWPTPADAPVDPPSGWPNCETPPAASGN